MGAICCNTEQSVAVSVDKVDVATQYEDSKEGTHYYNNFLTDKKIHSRLMPAHST